jgi:dihydroxyacetone kinase-like protein
MRVSVAQSSDLESALTLAGQVAMQSAQDTKDMIPLKGRASRLGERAVGHQDAGATSIAIILQSIAREVAKL